MSGSGRTIPIGAAELRAIRERESVLEQTLARLTGVDTATVERIENGETPLSTLEPDQIRQWAKTLGVNPARLTGETPPRGRGRDHRDPEDAHGTGMELPTARRTRERAIPQPAPIR